MLLLICETGKNKLDIIPIVFLRHEYQETNLNKIGMEDVLEIEIILRHKWENNPTIWYIQLTTI